jgi:4-methyl-5(b-hydroxyethyl)-thiazole monophosphate biosynthesis
MLMLETGGPMIERQGYVFVLWANNFEEVAATVFVSELREAGLRVKIVGLTGPNSRGTHGLGLVPDLTLDQALPLACQTCCLVIPGPASSFKTLQNDPRLHRFFEKVRSVQAWFVISSTFPTEAFSRGVWPFPEPEWLLVYPDNQEMVKFARDLVGLLN